MAEEPDGEPVYLCYQILLGKIISTVFRKSKIDSNRPATSGAGKADIKRPRRPGNDYNRR